MAVKAKDIIPAIRDAQILAYSHRCRTYVIALPSGRLKAVTRINPGDVVVVNEIVPSFENIEVGDIARQALAEFPDAEPTLDRFIDILAKNGAGNPRSPAMRAEALDKFISFYESMKMSEACKKAAECCFTNPLPKPHVSLWTRLGAAWR